MQNHYEINVAQNDKHFFATAERSLINREDAKLLYNDFQARFPASEGFEVTCSFFTCSGKSVTFEEF